MVDRLRLRQKERQGLRCGICAQVSPSDPHDEGCPAGDLLFLLDRVGPLVEALGRITQMPHPPHGDDVEDSCWCSASLAAAALGSSVAAKGETP